MLNKTDELIIEKTHKSIDYQSLSLAYASLIGDRSLQLYMQLIALSDFGLKSLNMETLEKISGMSLAILENSRFNLEKYQLIKTFNKDNQYIIKIEAPLDLYAFLSHEVYGRMFIQKNGETLYRQLLSAQNKTIDNSYVDISSSFNELIGSAWNDEKEQAYEVSQNEQITTDYAFDFDKFLGNGFDIVWPKKNRTQAQLNEIAKLANLYAHDEKNMRRLVCDNIDIKSHQLNLDGLKTSCAKASKIGQFDAKNPYDLPPKAFLKRLHPNAPISKVDQEVIEMLIEKYHFTNAVCNKLLEYAMAKSNYRLTKKFVEAVASTWSRAHVDSIEKAEEMINKDTKKVQFDFKNPYTTLAKPVLKTVKNTENKPHEMQKCNDDFEDF